MPTIGVVIIIVLASSNSNSNSNDSTRPDATFFLSLKSSLFSVLIE
jgi:hypothetical protein